MGDKASPTLLKRVHTVNELLTPKELADRWRISIRTLERLRELATDPLPSKKPFGRKVVFNARDVNRWLERQGKHREEAKAETRRADTAAS